MSTRWNINLTPTERAARIVLGSLATLAGIVFLTGATSALSAILEVLLVLTMARQPRSQVAMTAPKLGQGGGPQ